ncbi:MAG: phosphodiesterase [Bdellovibrio sp. ArHS]|uniref:alkaline phosphatase D family protein n=1 Tax=Bdellovibrio sp. ArHS TaxID=1569284 RepID=UPI0005828660|nr:alkaline phosphatase D family protein [Bdellovibrio sp. ArHS]KHD87711.1 MAG: phosphodiesterase [Bdellovibrio sp. ArHS]
MKKLLLLSLFFVGCSHTPSSSTLGAKAPVSTYVSAISYQDLALEKPLQRIAFGSCANQDQPEPLWQDIREAQPDLFLFMGDNVYASHPTQQPIAEQYRKMDQIPEYLAIRKEVPFMATWDDHDFGQRDGGADFKGKDQARKDFLNYWAYVKNSLPPEQQGVYHAKIIGPKNKSVQVIMLDTRYFRSPLKESPGNEGKAQDYLPQDEGTILGEAQWQWLEAQLKRPASVRFIVSSIQLIAKDPKYEKWGNFPKERQRFFDLLKSTKAKNVILLSGDRHIASIAKMNLKNYGALYEITSSSINRANNYADADTHYVGPVYSKENFGLARIDWKKRTVTVDIRGFKNKVENSVKIQWP